MKIQNKTQSQNSVQKLKDKKKFIRRIANIYWKPRKDSTSQYELIGNSLGGKPLKLTLVGSQNYTFKKLKEPILLEYINDDNRQYFDNSNINLSNTKHEISYTCNGHELDSFWEFCRVFPLWRSNNVLKIYILTTITKEVLNSNETQGSSNGDYISASHTFLVPRQVENIIYYYIVGIRQ